MDRKKMGFTLIELIVVILVLAVLSKFMVPRIINLTTLSNQRSTDSIAAALSAASAENFAKRTANSTQGSAVANCTSIGPLLPNGLPAGYTITSSAITAGTTVSCTLTGSGNTTATFTGLGIV